MRARTICRHYLRTSSISSRLLSVLGFSKFGSIEMDSRHVTLTALCYSQLFLLASRHHNSARLLLFDIFPPGGRLGLEVISF
jgi:hypothetical protein